MGLLRAKLRLILRGAAFCALAAGAGCGGSLPGIDLPPARELRPAREFPELRDYRGIVDCRPRKSAVTQVKLADLAHDAQIDFVALADPARPGSSDYGIGGFTGDTLIIPGASFQAGGGEIVGLNLREPIDSRAAPAAIIEAIHRQNALAIAVAPSRFSSADNYALADALEVYNLERAWAARSPAAIYLRAIFYGANHFFADLDSRPEADLARYDRMAAGGRVTMVAGLGGEENLPVFGVKAGTFEQILLVAATHVLAARRDADTLLDALKRGHAYVSFDILGYVSDFAFYAQSGNDKTMMGEEVPLSANLKLEVELPEEADQIAILKDGVAIASAEMTANSEFAAKARGVYRVEAYRRGRPWILSNPIYVR